MWAGVVVWVAVAVAVAVAGVGAQDRQHHSLVQPQQDVIEAKMSNQNQVNGSDSVPLQPYQLSDPNNEDGDSNREETRDYRGRQSTDGTHEGPGSGSHRQHGGPGRRRQHSGGGRGRQHPGTRQNSARQSGGNVGRGGRQFEVVNYEVGDGSESEASGPEISLRQMDTIILLLQRLSDRLAGIEVLQRQRAERIDNINYRLTRIELQAEERKGVVTELSNSVRHRMETTDAELDRVTAQLDRITTGISGLTQRHTELINTVNEIPKEQSEREGATNELKLQSMITTVHGMRTATQAIKKDINHLTQNMTMLNNITQNLQQMSEEMVTKQYLRQNLNELSDQDLTMSLLAKTMLVQPRSSRRGAGGARQSDREAEDCWEVQRRGGNQSGVYSIKPRYTHIPFFVYCDMETDGGGWTVIQRREDGTVDFLREWSDYKHGFGNLAGELWLGNERIHQLTSQHVSQLRVDLADYDQQKGYAVYSAFAVGSELEGYSLKMLGQYTGDAGDSLRYHVGRGFSTIDVDNDAWPGKSCARDHQGAWWYRACETSNLNGRYLHGPLPPEHQYTGLYWYDFRGPQYSLWRSRMMVRRGGSVSQPVFKDFKELQSNTPTLRPLNNSQTTTSAPSQDFNPDHDPYATYEYPYY